MEAAHDDSSMNLNLMKESMDIRERDTGMDVAWIAPQGAYCRVNVIYLLSKLGIKKGAQGLWPTPTLFIPRWTAHHLRSISSS